MKNCSSCHQDKKLSEFTVRRLRNGLPGLNARCKSCLYADNNGARLRGQVKRTAARRARTGVVHASPSRVVKGFKKCVRCGVRKPVSQFVKKVSPRKDGTPCYGNCLVCVRGDMTHYGRKYKYGISRDQFEQMQAAQSGACAICEEIPAMDARGHRVLCVDHDHSPNGKVRALLCQRCNRLLGQARDDASILQSALDYLKSYATL